MPSTVEDFDQKIEKETQKKDHKVFILNVVDETMKEFKLFFVHTLNQMTNSLKAAIFKVEVTNHQEIKFPATQKVEVTNHKEFPKEIKVSNLSDIVIPKHEVNIPEFPKFPDIKFPEIPKYPTKMEVSNMGEIVKQISKFADRPVKVTVKQGIFDKTPKVTVNVDNKEILTAIQGLQEAFKALADRKYPETDFSQVIDAVNKTTHSLDTLEFPVPQSTSSWQHSLTMQAEDLACTYVWKFVGTKEVLDYKEFTAKDGNLYRKTFTYNGTAKPTHQTDWEIQ